MLDRKQVVVEGVVLSGAGNVYSIPISVAVFGAASDKAMVRARLAAFRPRDELNARQKVQRSDSTGAGGAASSRGKKARLDRMLVPEGEGAQIEAVFNALQLNFNNAERADQPDAIRTKLFPHQLLWLSWARSHEESALGKGAESLTFEALPDGTFRDKATNTVVSQIPPPPRGGILADEMGLGKTLQVLSLIFDDIVRNPAARKPTLIVVPMAVLSVWERQVLDHVAVDKLPAELNVIRFHGAGRTKFKQADLQAAMIVVTTYDIVRSTFNKQSGKATGPLFAVDWRRVVLDEAHAIKNRNSVSCKSVCLLKTERRWCLTGTPIQNNLKDLFSLTQFLRVHPFSEFQWFNRLILRPIKDGHGAAFERLQVLVKQLVLRRTKETKIDGKPIIMLPDANQHVVMVPMSGDARLVYDTLFKAARREIDLLRTAGKSAELLRNYSNILVILLRLRQAALSLALLPDEWRVDAAAAAAALVGAIALTDKDKELLERGVTRMREMLAQGDEELNCIICLDQLNDPVLTRCSHFFCRACLTSALAASGNCPMCREPVNEASLVQVKVDEGAIALDLPEKGEDAPVVESAKVDALVAMVRASMHLPRAQRKLVVFSQFPTVFEDVGERLSELGLNCGVIEGKVSAAVRISLIERFHDSYVGEDAIDCMFVSLKAGGVGIDLSAGRFVYLLDMWWNVAVEEQAIARVHRLGVKHAVEIVRLVSENTVEQNILALQAAKNLAIQEAFAQKSPEELREARLKLVYNLFGEPAAVAGVERLADRIKEVGAIAPAEGGAAEVQQPIVLDGDDDVDNGVGNDEPQGLLADLGVKAPPKKAAKAAAKPKAVARTQSAPEPRRKRALFDEPIVLETKRARKVNKKYADYDDNDDEEEEKASSKKRKGKSDEDDDEDAFEADQGDEDDEVDEDVVEEDDE
jgi:SWI/SNF-related matrix-associated actin-dependent regulator of chromatin subfamily A3